MSRFQRWLAAAVCFSLATQSLIATAPARPMTARPLILNPYKIGKPQTIKLHDGRKVRVDRFGSAQILDAQGRVTEQRVLPATVIPSGNPAAPDYEKKVQALQSFLSFFHGSRKPYAPDALLVVFKDGVGPATDTVTVSQSALKALRAKSATQRQAPRYTNDDYVNRAFAKIGVSNVQRMLSSLDRSRLSSMHSAAQAAVGRPLLNIANAYRVTMQYSSVEQALADLRKVQSIAYAGPDWAVSPMHTQPVPMPDAQKQQLRSMNFSKLRQAAEVRTQSAVTDSAIPQNFSVVSSLQSMLNSSGIDALAAYDEIETKFHQLPGAGEIITNVSVGDITAVGDTGELCDLELKGLGPMTDVINGQRYLNLPGMPLIPAYAADAHGQIDPHYTECDAADTGEYDLDFSMMAGLPDEAQRAGERGTPVNGDILGVAPGASYRLVVPATGGSYDTSDTFESGIAGALAGAAYQTPKPDVITMSLGFGYDSWGFPGRYLEDDPVLESLIAGIVHAQNIVVCISANDGIRSQTPVSIGISGGSAPTNVTTDPSATTQLSNMVFSTIPSFDLDSGAIDVGGTTLNDVFSRPPQDPSNAAFANVLAYPETRYNGGTYLSSGFGSRVNISAPADNVLALNRPLMWCQTTDSCVEPVSEGGTSASAPEVAAAAAIALQVARLSGHPLTSATAVRDLLVQTATDVAQPQQTDVPLNVGPQLNVRRLVERLLADAGMSVSPAVKRIGIAVRRPIFPLDSHDSMYFTNTDPAFINLAGTDYGGGPDGSGLTSYLTLAPDWEGMPAGTSYALTIQGYPDRVLAATPFARVLPAAILSAAFPGTPVANSGVRTVHLTYRASSGKHMLAQVNFDLTFGPTDGTSEVGLAPVVPGAVKGNSFQVSYDVTHVRHMDNPMLVVTEPGRFAPTDSFLTHLIYAQPLTAKAGTVTVPVSALQGAGLYGIAVLSSDPFSGTQFTTDWATTRVEQGSALRAPAPTVKLHGDIGPGYNTLEISRTSSLDVSWDVSSVKGSTGALLETSAPGGTLAGIFSTFNNMNGSIRDDDGFNTGSTKFISLPGVRGTMTFTADELGLQNGTLQQIRVIPASGGVATGEASDVTGIVTDGLLNGIGGFLQTVGGKTTFEGGFAINPNGNDGMMLPWERVPGGYYSEVEFFDQSTGALQQFENNIYAGDGFHLNGEFYGGGLYNDAALVAMSKHDDSLLGAIAQTYASAGTYQSNGTYVFPLPPALTFPNQNYAVFQASSSNSSGKAALLVYDATQDVKAGPPMLMTLDMTGAAPVLGGPFPTSASMDGSSNVLLFGADTNLNKAVIVRQSPIDWAFGFYPVYIDLIDMSTGATTTATLQAMGVATPLAIDDVTHVAAMFSTGDNMLFTYNLQTGAQQKAPLPFTSAVGPWGGGINSFTPEYIAADPVNHLFLVESGQNISIANGDFNATPVIYVVDENGTLVKTLTGIGAISHAMFSENLQQGLQVNGHTRTAYLLTTDELQIFKY